MEHTTKPALPVRALRAFALASAALAAGCDLPDLTPCPDESRPAVEVEVVDSRTGDPAAEGAVGTLRDGSYTDSLVVVRADVGEEAYRMVGAYEREGTYDVRVDKEGYAAWTREDVRARTGECGVVTMRVRARLERE